MEVTSSTTATSSTFGQDLNSEDEQNQPLSSEAGLDAASSLPQEMDETNSTFGASSGDVTGTLQYGPVVCPDFYSHETSYCKDIRDSRAVHGSCGLYNLGNTCFMNSGLQSLMSCSPLVKFFSENFSLEESNCSTLTGHFYILLCKMWCGQFSVVHPKKFKEFLGLYHSQFEDYRQHDCQEFLAFLLDTLHEQLNESLHANNLSQSSPPLMCAQTARSSSSTTDGLGATTSTTMVSCSETELGRHHDHLRDPCQLVDNFHHKSDEVKNSVNYLKEEMREEKLVESSDFKHSRKKLNLNVNACSKSSQFDDTSAVSVDHVSGESSPKNVMSSGDIRILKNSDDDDSDFISSSGSALKRYTSRSNLDDVSSSDVGYVVKPSLKRVSTDTGVSASGLAFSSEDSNQSSISVHSTDSEQSSTFKRLKIESTDISRANSNCNSNSSSMKDFIVTSSSDCRLENQKLKMGVGEEITGVDKSDESVVSSNLGPKTGQVRGSARPASTNVMSTCHEDPMESSSSSDSTEEQLQLSNLEDFYKKETKTLNTNVLVSEHNMSDISCDSEKFAKVDNRHRLTSREINLLQEVFEEEDKVEKVLIGQQFAIKDTNLHTNPTSSLKSSNKSTKSHVILNNSFEGDHTLSCQALSKLDSTRSKQEVMSPLKMANDVAAGLSKLDEAEKNVQMQAYSKFNTTPPKSNIRIDLTDNQAVAKTDNDEADDDSSDDEDIDKRPHAGSVSTEECSSIPNCLRNCLPSEVAMANQAWQEYKARNNSIVVSTFQGQFRSTVVCSECSHVSVTYEPFMYLSLPIPHAMEQQMCVVYISHSRSPVRYLLNMMKTDKIGTCKKKLKEMVGLCGDVTMAEVLDSHISRILDDNILLKYVNMFNRKIYAFEVVTTSQPSRNVGDDNNDGVLLNNENRHHDSIMQEDLCLVSTSRVESGTDLLPYRTDSQLSNQSLDSIHVNTPSSRDTMDLGFSDSDMCEDASLSSPQQHLNLSPSYFEEEGAASRCGDDDLCQSTTSDTKGSSLWIHKGLTSLSANSHCLSWQIVQEKDTDDCDEETASTVTTVVGYSSSVSGDDCVAPCSSTRFWVDRPHSHSNSKDESVVLNSIENAAIADDEDNNVGSCNDITRHQDVSHSQQKETTAHVASTNVISSSHCDENNACVSHNDIGEDRNIDDPNGSKHGDIAEASTLSRLCPSPESCVGESNQMCVSRTSVSADPLDESPGSYFMQSPGLPPMDSICHTDSYGAGEDQPMNEDTEAKCLTDNWTSFDHVGSLPTPGLSSSCPDVSSGKAEAETSLPASCDQWRSCAICLEDLPISQMLIHVSCDGVFCQSCLDMSVKHTADVSFFCCPICLQPANVCEDFIPLPTSETAKLQARMLTVCIAFRHLVVDNTGSSSLQLVGHPKVVEMSSVMAGDDLYAMVDRLMGRPHLTYSVLLTDGQGLNCSRCPYSAHCMGCEIAREGELILRPSDNLTVHSCEMLSPEELLEMQHVHDDASMASLRSSEPTTIMDCFGAFTQSELLDEHNPWYCPMCERNQCAKKTMTVWRYPDNLIIHLKRFVYQDLSSTKVDTKVVFPHTAMDVRGFLSGPSSPGLIYDLYSVICHFGGASSGHYTCFAHHPLTSEWYYYNDETVTQQSPSDNEYSSGYVLFYRRQGTAVEFSPPQFLSSMEESPTQASSTSTFHEASTTATTTDSSTSTTKEHHHHRGSNDMALVLFVPPTSTTPSSNNILKKTVADDNEDDDDDYDCERRCSPSSDYGSLSVHFGSVLPDPDNMNEEDEGLSNGTHTVALTDEMNGSPAAEPDSTFDFYW